MKNSKLILIVSSLIFCSSSFAINADKTKNKQGEPLFNEKPAKNKTQKNKQKKGLSQKKVLKQKTKEETKKKKRN